MGKNDKQTQKTNFSFNREMYAERFVKKTNNDLQSLGALVTNETQRFFAISKSFKISIKPVEKIEEVKTYLDKKKCTSQKHEQGIIIFYPNTEEFFEKGDDEEYFENERVAIKNFLKGKNIVIIGKGNKGQYKFNKKIENASTGIIIVHAQNVQIANQIKSLLSKIRYAGNQLVDVNPDGKEVHIIFDPKLYKKVEIVEEEKEKKGEEQKSSSAKLLNLHKRLLTQKDKLFLNATRRSLLWKTECSKEKE